MIKAVIFDMDGVLVDTEPLIFASMREYLKQYGADLTLEEFESYIGMVGNETFKRIVKKHSIAIEPEELKIRFQNHHEAHFDDLEGVAPIQGVKELIEALAEMNIPLGVASSSPSFMISKTVKKIGLDKYFKSMRSSQDLPRPKPFPDVYLAVAKDLETDAGFCAAVEDTDIGIEAANGAGMVTVAYKNPTSGKQNYSAADIVVDDIRLLQPSFLLGISK